MQELVSRLVSALEKGKPSLTSPYLFHLFDKNECLRGEEMDTLEAAQIMLQFEVAPEAMATSEPIDLDSERESLRSEEIWELLKETLGAKRKKTYRAMEGKEPICKSN